MGNMAYVAKAMLDKPADKKNMAEARKETESVIIGAIDELLAKTGVKPRDIGILVANSSLFMLKNHATYHARRMQIQESMQFFKELPNI
ncbi:hypothetical protein AB3S75_044485 [Citrus x aurantiifolia]